MSEATASDYLLCICPICRTRFRVSDELLNAAGGQVRCGACLTVFNGRDHLLEPTATAEQNDIPSSPSSSRSQGSPRSQEEASTTPAPAYQRLPPTDTAAQLGLSIGVLLLGAGLLVNVFWLRFEVWSQQPALRTLYESACEVVDCRLRPLRALADIEVASSVFQTRHGPPDELELAFELRNRAPFKQPFPTLLVRLRDEQGKVLATHRRPPKDYLDVEETRPMEPQQSTPVVLRFDDPGARAADYSLSLL